jgi:hypothetical protein
MRVPAVSARAIVDSAPHGPGFRNHSDLQMVEFVRELAPYSIWI